MIASKEVLDLIHSIGTVCFPGVNGYFLYASSWHHVNLKPVVFYYLNEELIFNGFASRDDFHAFISYAYGDDPELG